MSGAPPRCAARRAAALAIALAPWIAAPHVAAAEPLTRFGVVLLQNSEVLQVRVSNIDAMAEYLRAIETAARDTVRADAAARPNTGFIVVAVRQGLQSRVWLDFDAAYPFEASRKLTGKLAGLAPFDVKQGPVVFALKVGLWGGSESARVAPSPAAWKAATQKAGKQLELDELMAAVWP